MLIVVCFWNLNVFELRRARKYDTEFLSILCENYRKICMTHEWKPVLRKGIQVRQRKRLDAQANQYNACARIESLHTRSGGRVCGK